MTRPSVAPDFATDANYVAAGKPWDGQPTKVTPGAIKTEGWEPQVGLAAQHVNYMLNNHGDWINFLDASVGGIFGDGSDGAATFDGATNYNSFSSRSGSVYTLTRDVFLTDATLSAGVTIKTVGFRIYINGTLTMTSAAPIIHCDGNDGSAGTAGAAVGNILASSGAGGNGGASGGPNNGSAGTSVTAALGGSGGLAGTGAGGAGAAGTATAPTAAMGNIRVPGSVSTGMLFGVSGAGGI